MFRDLLNRIRTSVSKAVGRVGHVLKRVGQVGLAAGRFVAENHQPLALATMGLAEATGNERFKNIAGLGMMGSAALTAAGVGRDFGFYNNPPRPT